MVDTRASHTQYVGRAVPFCFYFGGWAGFYDELMILDWYGTISLIHMLSAAIQSIGHTSSAWPFDAAFLRCEML
jgi:hypothetical protein